MEYKILKVKDKLPKGYEVALKCENNWFQGEESLVGIEITDSDLKNCDYRVPIVPQKLQTKVENKTKYKTLKVGDKRLAGYEISAKGKENWEKGYSGYIGTVITNIDLMGHDYRVPIIQPKRRVKIERTPHCTYTVSAIAEAQKLAEESQKLSKRITEISIEINKILKGSVS